MDRYNKYMYQVKNININDFAPPEIIQDFETPFKWIQGLKCENFSSSEYLQKFDDYVNQGESYSFEKLIPFLALGFEYSLIREFNEAKNCIQKVEDLICTMKNNNDCLYSRIGEGLNHILFATKLNILLFENKDKSEIEDLKEKCKGMKPISDMDPMVQAGVHAVRAKFYLTCTSESELALSHMMEASNLDPNFALWKYWCGKIIRKIRRNIKEFDPSAELSFFEEAVQMDRDAKHLVFLAQAYKEKASFMHKNKNAFPELTRDEFYIEIDSLNEKATQLYIESVELNPTSAAISRRAGNGLMTLPKGYARFGVAKQLLHKAEELSQNPVTYHILGTYYTKVEGNQEKAVEYFTKTAENNMVYGFHELIRIKYGRDKNYDPLEDLLKAHKSLRFSSDLKFIEGDLGFYYLTMKNDLPKAIEHFLNVMKIEDHLQECSYLKKYYSYCFFVKGPVNMYKVLKKKIIDIDEDLRDDLMKQFLEMVNENEELLDENVTISLEKAEREAKSTLIWQRKKNDKSEDKLCHNSQTKFPKSKDQRSNSVSENPNNWRRKKETERNDSNHVTLPERREAKMPPKQENWRLECRKF